MSVEAAALAEQADLLIGAARLVDAWPGKTTAAEYRPEQIRRIIEESHAERIAVLVSGDAGFFSGAGAIAEALKDFAPEVYPGISSLAAFSAKTGLPYDRANLLSAHGKEIRIVSEVRRHRVTFVLGGGNLHLLLEQLHNYGMDGVEVLVGENLGYPEEQIHRGTPEELKTISFHPLAVMAVVNPQYTAPVSVSLPDAAFQLGSVPMTKELVRGAIIRKLCLREDSVVYDIGAGTGSVSVEAALNAWRGTVYAFDRKEEAVDLIRENARRLQADNIVAVHGTAPQILRDYPMPDAVFIGGSEGKLEEILDALLRRRLEEGAPSGAVNVVVSAVTLQSLEQAAACLKKLAGKNRGSVRIVQVSENRVEPIGRYDMFRPETPVFILSAAI